MCTQPDNSTPERVVIDVADAYGAKGRWRGSDWWRKSNESKPERKPKGLKVTERQASYMDGDEKVEFTSRTYTLPEAGPTRCFKWDALRAGIVVPICGRRWRVTLIDQTRFGGDDEIPTAENYKVCFEQTGDPETPFEAWDHAAAVERARVRAEREILNDLEDAVERNTAEHNEEGRVLTPDEIRAKVRRWCDRAFRDLESIAAGTMELWPNSNVTFFGQPQFIQNDAIIAGPSGDCAMALCTLDTGWSDAGNENFLFTVDENGIPECVWHEASAH